MNEVGAPQTMTPIVVQLQKTPPEQNWVEIGHGVESWLTAVGLIVGAVWAVFGDWRKTRAERDKDRELASKEQVQRERQLKWDQAKLAKEINDEFMEDEEAQGAVGLVDNEAEFYELTDPAEPHERFTYDLSKEEQLLALRTGARVAGRKGVLLRDCFDAWFYWMSLMEQYLQAGLILQEDIAFPSDYYLRQLRNERALYEACVQYIDYYRLSPRIHAFMQRFAD